jgi:hypothetical protein
MMRRTRRTARPIVIDSNGFADQVKLVSRDRILAMKLLAALEPML